MKKKLMTVLALVLVIAMSVAGTYAYLTSQDEVVNTFTVGKVAITLDETKVDLYGDVVTGEDAGLVKANTYKLIPGHSYTKDPTVHVDDASENSWLFVKVENGIEGIEAAGDTTIAAQLTQNGWTALSGVENVYYYKDVVTGGANCTVFKNFKIAGDAATSAYADAKITVTAYAVQADGFKTAADAWKAADFGA